MLAEHHAHSLETLHTLWQQEQKAVRARFLAAHRSHSLEERVARGEALRHLRLLDTSVAPGDRWMLWLAPQRQEELQLWRFGTGVPVRLWWDMPESDDVILGVLARKRRDRIGVMIDRDPPFRLEHEKIQLDRDDPGVTFERGLQAIRVFRDAKAHSPAGYLRRQLYEAATPEKQNTSLRPWRDSALNEGQKYAVQHTLSTTPLSLLHGPPGTGKTRTLVEVIWQAVQQQQRVLACAASHAAVDHLTQQLSAAGLRLVRIGHPARVSDALEACTLDAQLAQTEIYALAQSWMREARALHRKLDKNQQRGHVDRDAKRQQRQDARRLRQDARHQLRQAQELILSRAQVVCVTASSATTKLIQDLDFDLVVLDEATQAPDPVALIALSRAPRAIFAGDPRQLPPTVIDPQAQQQGLGSTYFERLTDAHDTKNPTTFMLTTQYRMNAQLMEYPSRSMYHHALTAAPKVASRRLEDLPDLQADPLRPGPLVFIDTAGKGWEEYRPEAQSSTSNPEQAQRTAAEVQRLLGRGLAPADIAVIAPYRAQVLLLRERLAKEHKQGLEIDSIDAFQGREKEAVVIDLVRSNDNGEIGFLADTRRMNVAITRAKRFLLVLGDSATIGQHPYYEAWLSSIEIEGKWCSAWEDDAPPFDEDPPDAETTAQ